MSNFNFKARNKHGNLITGVRTAASSHEIYKILLHEELTPVSIELISEEATKDVGLYIQSLRPNSKSMQDEKLLFCRQMHSLLKAGIPVINAINTIQKTVKNSYFKKILRDVAKDLSEGIFFSVALHKYKRVFSGFFVGIIVIGEKTGGLDNSFKYLAQYYGQASANKYKLKDALRYPMILCILFLFAIVILNIIFFPIMKKVYDKYEGDLPLITDITMAIGSFIINYWYLAIGIFLLILFIINLLLKTEKFKTIRDKYKLKIPILGWIYKRVLIQRFCQSFAVTIDSGYALHEGLLFVKDTVDNKYFADLIKVISNNIAEGKTFYDAVDLSGFFPPIFMQLIRTAETSGDISSSLYFIADHYDEELNYDFKNFVEIVRPLLILIIALFLAVFILSVLLPYYKLVFVVSDYINYGPK